MFSSCNLHFSRLLCVVIVNGAVVIGPSDSDIMFLGLLYSHLEGPLNGLLRFAVPSLVRHIWKEAL
jgi:hypothetical protein